MADASSTERGESASSAQQAPSVAVAHDGKTPLNGKRKRAEVEGDAGDETANEGETLVVSLPTSTALASGAEPAGREVEAVGTIEEIYCVNFMCHRKLRVRLTPHINFIAGENGSGKSSITKAIQICLDPSAFSNTDKPMEKLIRRGHKGDALVQITLRNQATCDSRAFRPSAFGKRITVERRIRHDGSTECSMKNEGGAVVTTRKEDLVAMLGHFEIQLKNPIMFFDERTAKLMRDGDSSMLYKCVFQSTDLSELREMYVKMLEDATDADSVVSREKEQLASLQESIQRSAQRCEEAHRDILLDNEFAQMANTLHRSISGLEEQFGRVKQGLADVERLRTMLETHQLPRRKLRASYWSAEFNRHLLANGFAGRLTFRHDEQRLEIAVVPIGGGISKKSDMLRLDELSSGERSYAIVALLLALSEQDLESPFRVVDAFDVGMDYATRDKAMQALVNEANLNQRKQSIFVTACDVKMWCPLRSAAKIRVVKVSHPRTRLWTGQQE